MTRDTKEAEKAKNVAEIYAEQKRQEETEVIKEANAAINNAEKADLAVVTVGKAYDPNDLHHIRRDSREKWAKRTIDMNALFEKAREIFP